MPHLDAVWVLTLAAGVLGLLALKEWIHARRITPAVKARLLIVIIFVAVLIWLHGAGPFAA